MANHLAGEASPYLKMHADNPVNWYPWNASTLQIAQQEHKPILLSIGYTACHWCHVMAAESFVDAATADLMNKYFINIKVDREERPDLDKIYQRAYQLIAGRGGGWPLTLFLTPNGAPFFGGTYFPKEARYGLPSFKQVLQRIADYFQQNSTTVTEISHDIQQALAQLNEPPKTTAALNDEVFLQAYQTLQQQFDEQHGGFGDAPKFPNPSYLNELWFEWYANNNPEVLELITITLDKMAEGGLYDQLAGGFFRYSVDAAWTIPHFEKMLYDNAQLIDLYATAYLNTHNPCYGTVVTESCDWVINTMRASHGGFYATLCADSEGVEGKFYVFEREEIKKILTDLEYQIITLHFGLNHPANFENHYWHLLIDQSSESIAKTLNLSNDEVAKNIISARNKLLNLRNQRISPQIDNKILTAWNALMIKGLLTAGIYLQNENYLTTAFNTLDFIIKNLWRQEQLYAVYADNHTYQLAFLDDYAFLLDALLLALQIRWSSTYFSLAVKLADKLVNSFFDSTHGGFYFTEQGTETLVHRPKSTMDDVLPSGSALAAYNLLRLGHLLTEPKYMDTAERSLRHAWPMLEDSPFLHHGYLNVLRLYLNPPTMIIIRGNTDDIPQWQAVFWQNPQPHTLCLAIDNDTQDLPEVLAQYPKTENTTAYICQNQQCQAGIMELVAFKDAITSSKFFF